MQQVLSGTTRMKQALSALQTAISALQSQSQIVLAIPGGRSVVEIFRLLKNDKTIHWQNVHLFLVDERMVPIYDDQSNFKLAKETFIDQLIEAGRLPQANVHPFVYQPGEADKGIGSYQAELKRFGGKYDILLLGVGEDGHIGALFPSHHSIRNEAPYFLTMDDSPKPPPTRMTASKQLLANASYALAFFLGESKQAAYKNFKNKKRSVEDCPAKLINAIAHSYIVTDLE